VPAPSVSGTMRGARFAPQHMTSHRDLTKMFEPFLESSSRTPAVIRLPNGGRLDFWSLENSIVGRGRGYQRVVIDEGAFAKDGDNRSEDSMMAHWEKGIKPTLFDYGGQALVCSNSAGKNPDNFFYNICTDRQYGFHEFHATTMDNPLLPGEGLSLLEKGLGCTLPESQQEGGLSVGAVGPQGASQWRDYPRRSVRARAVVQMLEIGARKRSGAWKARSPRRAC
jgi:hypothetical protein